MTPSSDSLQGHPKKLVVLSDLCGEQPGLGNISVCADHAQGSTVFISFDPSRGADVLDGPIGPGDPKRRVVWFVPVG